MNTTISFKLAIIELVMLAISISWATASYILDINSASSMTAIPILIASVISFIGCYYSLKSLPEPNNLKKIIALIVNFCFASLFIILVISNLMDIIKLFKD